MITTMTIARLKISLDDVEPAVVRCIEAPIQLRLDQLHTAIQTAMGWTDSHLYQFRCREFVWGIRNPDWDFGDGPLDARKTTLGEVIETTGAESLGYLYDFGDGWEHTIQIERTAAADPGITYPRLLDAVGRCPPEDVGGPPGYEEFVAAIADPDHEEHDTLREWAGSDFDPNEVNAADIAQALARLGTRWESSG